MYSVAAAVFSILAIAATAPMAVAEDRISSVDDSRKAAGETRLSDVSAVVRAHGASGSGVEGGAHSPSACRGQEPSSSAEEGCEAARGDAYGRIRSIDWSSVGPSADDFAPTEDTLRLQGARLVGTYRF